jgi:hypothetical protein
MLSTQDEATSKMRTASQQVIKYEVSIHRQAQTINRSTNCFSLQDPYNSRNLTIIQFLQVDWQTSIQAHTHIQDQAHQSTD